MSKFELRSFSAAPELARTAAADWLAAAEAAGRPWLTAFSGGRIAKVFFEQITAQARNRRTNLEHVEFFWADERCVPPGDPESNFRLANETLLQPLDIAASRIHRLRGELSPPVAAAEANVEIAAIAPSGRGDLPVLDLVILGMGEDGHVASLFPNAPPEVINCNQTYLHVENSPKQPPLRLTLSYQAIAAATNVWVLVSGSDKQPALQASLRPGAQTPLGRVLQLRSRTTLYIAEES
jgi:6-phosphogluconolactonase